LRTTAGSNVVAILGGSSVVGRALESLLRPAGYDARFFPEHSAGLAGTLGGASVALILPSLNTRRKEALIARLTTAPPTADLPIIELAPHPDRVRNGQRTIVPWPCSLEELERSIEAALSARHETGEADSLPL
jgi:hypothetical protein